MTMSKNTAHETTTAAARHSLQVCTCGWAKITSFSGLRIHQGKRGCLREQRQGPHIDQYFLRSNQSEIKLERMGDIIYLYGEERFGVNTRRSDKATPAPAKSRRQQDIERLDKERRQLRKQWKKASDAEREGLMLLRGTSSVGWQPWLWLHGFKGYTATTNGYNGAAMFGRRSGSFAQIVLLSTFLRIFAFSSYTHNVCTDCLRQKNTFGHWTPLH